MLTMSKGHLTTCHAQLGYPLFWTHQTTVSKINTKVLTNLYLRETVEWIRLACHFSYWWCLLANIPHKGRVLQLLITVINLAQISHTNYNVTFRRTQFRQLHSTLPITKKNMQRFCFVIGGFSLRAMYFWVKGVYLVWRFSFVIQVGPT